MRWRDLRTLFLALTIMVPAAGGVRAQTDPVHFPKPGVRDGADARSGDTAVLRGTRPATQEPARPQQLELNLPPPPPSYCPSGYMFYAGNCYLLRQ